MNKLLVKKILESATSYNWSLQGFGMLRLYLSKEVRLHVWDDRYRVKNVSTIHTHPWHFESHIIAGHLENIRYKENVSSGNAFKFATIKCGEGGGKKSSDDIVWLSQSKREVFVSNDSYTQQADEIHESLPENGTVTIVERSFPVSRSCDHAKVYWSVDSQWISAEPRPATVTEVMLITQNALETWF